MRDRGVMVRRLALWAPVVLGGISLLLVLAHIQQIIGALYANGDVASAPVIGALIGHAPADRTVLLGQYPWYESLWFMELTHGLPAYRQIWEAAPIAFSAFGYGLLIACAWVCFGRTRGLLVGALLASTSVEMRTVLFTLDFHGALVVHACVLLAGLVIVLRAERLAPWAIGLLAVLVGCFTALGVASDKTMYIAAIVPFLLTGVGMWARSTIAAGSGRVRERRLALFTLAVCTVAVVGGELAAAAMRHDRVIAAPYTVSFVSLGHLASNIEIFLSAFASLAGGEFFGASATGTNFLTFVAGVLGFAALAAVARWLWQRAPTLCIAPEEESSRSTAATAYIIFWALVLVCLTGGFVLTSTPIDASSARYIACDFVAVAALLPALAPIERGLAHGVLAVAITLFVGLGLYFDIDRITGPPNTYPTSKTVAEIERYLLAHGARNGYAPYWDAADVSWGTHLHIHAYPLERCTLSLGVCPMRLNQISSWYAPTGSHVTFLLTDLTNLGNVPIPDPFGTFVTQAVFGNVNVYIYDHDVAGAL